MIEFNKKLIKHPKIFGVKYLHVVSYNSVKNGSLMYCCMIVLFVYYDLFMRDET
jgi:hypothetical protein